MEYQIKGSTKGPKREVEILTDNIKLDQFLKWSGVVSTGGEAKRIVADGLVKVNGVPEKRRGRVLAPGDIVDVEGLAGFLLMKRREAETETEA